MQLVMTTLQKQTSLFTEETLTFSQVDFHASPSLLPETEKEKMITVSSGLICLERSKRLNRDGLLLKTLLESSQWIMAKHLKGYSMRWKMRGIKRKYIIY